MTIERNLLSSDILELVRRALEAGPVLGRLHHYAGGSSADNWAFRSFAPFKEYISGSRPGDLYEIWPVPDLLAKDMALLRAAGHALPAALPGIDRHLARIKVYLDIQFNEYFALFLWPTRDTIEVQLNDVDGFEDLQTNVVDCVALGGESIVFPFTRIATPEHMLVEAKYPDSEGRVPLGGPY